MMCMLLPLFIVFTLHFVNNVPISTWERTLLCTEIPTFNLQSLMGNGFNPRYMSVEKPVLSESSQSGKRGASFDEDFAVDDSFLQVDSEPAWNAVNRVALSKKSNGLRRTKRNDKDYLQEWHCKSRIEWVDLGPDYYPRYLRKMVCETEKCWFGVYKCKPRGFTVRVLRRKKGYCANSSSTDDAIGYRGLPKDLLELWVYEERPVNFCCDCARN